MSALGLDLVSLGPWPADSGAAQGPEAGPGALHDLVEEFPVIDQSVQSPGHQSVQPAGGVLKKGAGVYSFIHGSQAR
jgi:hypothetical protein